MSEAHATTVDCRFCWMCRHVCPVGHVTKRETFTPHAWALLIESVARKTIAWNAETADVLYTCADCGMCRTHCVTDRPLPEAIADARAEVAALGLAPRAAYDLRDAFEQALTAPAPAQTTTGEMALFVGGHAAGAGRAALDAALTLLDRIGVRPALIGEGRGNGAVASALGFPETARAQVRAVADEVAASGCRQLLVVGVEDRFGLERVAKERLGLEWPATVAIVEVTTLLADAVEKGRLRFAAAAGDAPAYAYHDPCHGPRLGRDGAAPRALLQAALGAPERPLFWRGGRAHPCGAVGGLELTQPQVAVQLADARLEDAAAAGATELITDDPTCLRHLQSRSGAGVSVVGLYELLAGRA